MSTNKTAVFWNCDSCTDILRKIYSWFWNFFRVGQQQNSISGPSLHKYENLFIREKLCWASETECQVAITNWVYGVCDFIDFELVLLL